MKLLKRSAMPMIAVVVAFLLLLSPGSLLIPASAATGAVTGPNGSYSTMKAAVDASVAGDTLQLNQDLTENVTIRKNLTIDLNGHTIGTITVSNGKVVSVMDSSTDDFDATDGYGTVAGKAGTGKLAAAPGYLALTAADGKLSYHRLDLEMDSVSLRPSVAGVYYTGRFGGDHLVKEQVATYGTILSIYQLPTASKFLSGSYQGSHTEFAGASWISGQLGKSHGTLLTGILKETNTAAANQLNAEQHIQSMNYAKLKDGTVVFGQPVSFTFQELIETVDGSLSDLNSVQGRGLRTMYNTYQAVMDSWNIPNLKNLVKTQPAITLSDASVKAGSTVKVTVDMKNNPGILGAIFSISYDSSVLTLTGATNGVTADGVKYTAPSRFKDPTVFMWDALDPTWTQDGTVLTLTFKVAANAPKGTYPITLNYDPYDIFDGEGTPIDFDLTNATIEVK